MSELMKVLIPAPESHASVVIVKGSGIVGRDLPDGRLLVDIEGNVYDVANMRTYPQRVFHAGGRAKEDYPTMARSAYEAHEFMVVGTLDPETWLLTFDRSAAARRALSEWLGDEASDLPDQVDLKAWDREHPNL